MIIGSVEVQEDAVNTHRDSYLLKTLTVVSVRRPFFAPSIAIGTALIGFGIAFIDLLYESELAIIALFVFALFAIGHQLGQLKLVSRDLKSTELSGAIWGQYVHLQSVRRDIVTAMKKGQEGA